MARIKAINKDQVQRVRGDAKPVSAVGAREIPPEQPKQAKRTAASRWTDALIEGGFTPISNFFLEFACELRPEITHGEAMFIVHLMFFKWDDKMPRPGFKTIAKRMGIRHPRARALARQLERKKYLTRHKQMSMPNHFDLRPLFHALERLRDQKIAEVKAAEARRRPRKL